METRELEGRKFPSKKSDTKYRDIADGNTDTTSTQDIVVRVLETKYRDIADGNVLFSYFSTSFQYSVGNQVPRYSGWKPMTSRCSRCVVTTLETKYRDIADGNSRIVRAA